MIDAFLIKAVIAGMGIAIMAGPLGCFIAWQRLAYFGEMIAHAALLGVVGALLMQVDFTLGILVVALVATLLVYGMKRGRRLASDTALGIVAHGALALALVILSLSKTIAVDINGFLFGDILAVNDIDIAMIYMLAAAIGIVLILSWRQLMCMVVHADIAQVEGVPTRALQLLVMLCIALAVAVSIKIIGMLLITSLLIIPAASMRFFARTPTQMAILASLAGMVSVCGGLYASLRFDTPSGPSIILVSLAIFAVGFASSLLQRDVK